MKYVILNFIGKKGGAPLYSYEMAKGLIENGFGVYAILPDNIENKSEWMNLKNVSLYFIRGYTSISGLINTYFHFRLLDSKKIKKATKKIDIKCVYVPMIQPLSNMVDAMFKGKELVVTLHDPKPHPEAGRVMTFLYNQTVKKADEIIVLSKGFIPYTAKVYNKSPEHIHYIPHGIFDNYKKIYNPDYKHNYPKNKINFLFFGRICEYKGLEVLGKAFKKLSQKYDNVFLTIVGNGDFSPYKILYMNQKNVEIINRWIKDEEVYGFFNTTGVITVLPYTSASQSGVIPLAQASRSLVICSDTGGLNEQIQNNKTGILVKPNNMQDLYRAMESCITDSFDSIIDNAEKHIDDLSWDKLARRLIQIIDK